IHAQPQYLGDLDEDGEATVLDLVRLAAHVQGTDPLPSGIVPFADLNLDGYVNELDADRLVSSVLGQAFLPEPPLARVRATSPDEVEVNVAVTREAVFRLTFPLAADTQLATDHVWAEAGGRRLLSRVELSSDRRTVTLFYLENVPGSAQVTVRFHGDGIEDFLGRPVDPDGDGVEGGIAELHYGTLSVTPVGATAVIGRVFASELVPGSDNTSATVNVPLEGVTITVDGMEETLRTTTDANGSFKLQPVPAGTFFVHVDGRTATASDWPGGDYYPAVGKAWTAVAGRDDNLASGTGEIFLPLIRSGTLTPVRTTEPTVVTFPPSVIESNAALAGVELVVPPNGLLS